MHFDIIFLELLHHLPGDNELTLYKRQDFVYLNDEWLPAIKTKWLIDLEDKDRGHFNQIAFVQ